MLFNLSTESDQAHLESLPVTVNHQHWSTNVRFVPTETGSHYVSARFEPMLGRAQTDVQVAVDRSAAEAITFAMPAPCEVLETVPSGVLCKRSVALELWRNQVKVQEWTAIDFAVAGNVVWMLKGGLVSRWVDSGAGLTQVPATGVDVSLLRAPILVARQDSVVVVNIDTAIKVRFLAGALVGDPPVSSVAAPRPEPISVYADPELKAVLVVGSSRFCRVKLEDAPGADCVAANGRALGSDSGGVWSLEPRITASPVQEQWTLVHRAFGQTVDGPLRTTTLALGRIPPNPEPPPSHQEGAPVLWTHSNRTHQVVLKLGPDGILYERFPEEEGFTLMPGSTTTVRAQASDGRQKLFQR